MQVVPSGYQVCDQCMWLHLVAKFGTNTSGAIWWRILHLMQIAPPGDQNWNQCLFLAGEITQIKEAIAWARCASGNVYFIVLLTNGNGLHWLAFLSLMHYFSGILLSRFLHFFRQFI